MRARNAAKLSQRDLAETLHLSQPYIAQVERGSKLMSLSLMVRYANAVGATIEVKPKKRAKHPAVATSFIRGRVADAPTKR